MDIKTYTEALCARANHAAPILAAAKAQTRRAAILRAAELLIEREDAILASNAIDLANAEQSGMSTAMMDRLRLTHERIAGIADALRVLADLADPTGSGEVWTRPNGLVLRCVRVPLGTVGVIYEARPNVTADIAALCIKTGNAALLRGGKEALETNKAVAEVLRRALTDLGLPADAVCLMERTEREGAQALMNAKGKIDVLIPRGGKGLIRAVVEGASVPVIETGAGNCHIYIDESADLDMALSVTENAKLSRPAVCNAVETLLVHERIAAEFLPLFARKTGKRLTLRGCADTRKYLPGIEEASELDYETEYDDCILAVRVVKDTGEAIRHINRYSTGHSEAIITRSLENAKRFEREIDSACVYVNASTRFSDGGEFGFGAEVGISTQKLHARGPMGPDALTTVKYIIEGNGQIR